MAAARTSHWGEPQKEGPRNSKQEPQKPCFPGVSLISQVFCEQPCICHHRCPKAGLSIQNTNDRQQMIQWAGPTMEAGWCWPGGKDTETLPPAVGFKTASTRPNSSSPRHAPRRNESRPHRELPTVYVTHSQQPQSGSHTSATG